MRTIEVRILSNRGQPMTVNGIPPQGETSRAGRQSALPGPRSAFLVTYMLIAPLFGMLADRMRRWALVGIGVVIWSLASGASGLDWVSMVGVPLATAYWLLLLTRCFVGVGEGAYGPVAPTMLAD